MLQNANVSAAIIGASRPEQVTENVKAAGVKLEAERAEADRRGPRAGRGARPGEDGVAAASDLLSAPSSLLSRIAPAVDRTSPDRTAGHQPGRTPSPSSSTPMIAGTNVSPTIIGAVVADTGARSRPTE